MDYVLDGVEFSFLYTVKQGGVPSHDKDISLFSLDVPHNLAIAAKEAQSFEPAPFPSITLEPQSLREKSFEDWSKCEWQGIGVLFQDKPMG
ncbi:unnamed protein product [Nezara viridula]|uniref:Uncharacterized protein n=1 Tax=Nezara viridula TaxID=85310 RepID=A0A9P0E7F5_NEZVI|nr:unnamed protein product [Nezara viridula]